MMKQYTITNNMQYNSSRGQLKGCSRPSCSFIQLDTLTLSTRSLAASLVNCVRTHAYQRHQRFIFSISQNKVRSSSSGLYPPVANYSHVYERRTYFQELELKLAPTQLFEK
ncbi:Hypothetical_protein [Hexamita inflata]|uniref:Hypothetical_protein n=1 Tax=Hexamita inflata TaxID=28002 RepID=A0AA86QF66_9EUKA|nr:Hypothetical protein HINF_LOCUS43361 [Hexamita inflata]